MLTPMKLIGKETFKQELWLQSGSDLLTRFSPNVKESYPFIFSLGDWKSLLALQNEAVQEQIEFMQSCLIESMIELSLNEIMHPIQYKTAVHSRGQIDLASQCKLGTTHCIAEIIGSSDWELSRWTGSGAERSCEEIIRLQSIDEIVDSVAAIETTWRNKRSIFRDS